MITTLLITDGASAIGITLNLAFVILDVTYERLSNPLILVADAGPSKLQ
jgi:hypothetical protein